jgi:nicotinamide-nucleotide amidase
MQVGLLIIASEVLDGKVADTNTQTLSLFLRSHHLELSQTLTVRDHPAAIHQGLDFLFQACQLVITSGGLGPTPDDLTKAAIATFLQRKIIFSSAAMQVAQENYQRFDRVFPGKEHGYSFLPEHFMALPNSAGYAPGLYGADGNRLIFSAPGVPREFRAMLEDHLIKLLSPQLKGSKFLDAIVIRTSKIPEEKIFGELDTKLWQKLESFGEVSSLPVISGVDIVVKTSSDSEAGLELKRQGIDKILQASPLKSYIWHLGAESLEQVIVTRAISKNIRFGFAESATGGLCSHRITNVAGSSSVFMGSVISYAEAVKTSELGVDAASMATHGVVSQATAEAMARGLATHLKLDLAVSITGYAGPGGGSADKPVGTVCIGLWYQGQLSSQQLRFYGDREQLKNRFAQAALMALLEAMAENA